MDSTMTFMIGATALIVSAGVSLYSLWRWHQHMDLVEQRLRAIADSLEKIEKS